MASNDHYGFEGAQWKAALAQATEVLSDVAKRRKVITYSDLVTKISAINFEPQDVRLAHLLGEISEAEDKAGRGMLSVVVVHKQDSLPGDGFFQLAKSLGRVTRDRTAYWVDESKKVYDSWSAKTPSA
jgi:hypothetical protein